MITDINMCIYWFISCRCLHVYLLTFTLNYNIIMKRRYRTMSTTQYKIDRTLQYTMNIYAYAYTSNITILILNTYIKLHKSKIKITTCKQTLTRLEELEFQPIINNAPNPANGKRDTKRDAKPPKRPVEVPIEAILCGLLDQHPHEARVGKCNRKC